MFRKRALKSFSIIIILCIGVVAFGLGNCIGSELGNAGQKAFELRMNGQVDEAKALLEKTISEDSTNALAHYELARTKYHIGLGNPRELINKLTEIQYSIDQAIKYDPANVIYTFFKGRISFLSAYVSIQRNQPDTKEEVIKACRVFESALKLKPDYSEVMLYLVEIYGLLPGDMGGDRSKAEKYAKQLEKMDKFYGAKARSMLLSEDVDRVDFWKKVQENQKGNTGVLEELGRAYLHKGEDEKSTKCFEQAVKIDPAKRILFLDLARYHIMSTMRDKTKKDTALPKAEEAIKKYLNSEPIPPLKAYTLELSAKVKFGMSDNKGAGELRAKAQAIYPYYSKASAVPPRELFVSPQVISHNHEYYFRPF